MRFRKLRIAFSVTCGIVAVMLCVLWTRSYYVRINCDLLVTPAYRYYLHSLNGTLAVNRDKRLFFSVELMRQNHDVDWQVLTTKTGVNVERNSDGEVSAISISYWLLTLATVTFAAIPWLSIKRFSLRTLLIATTLVAAVLGLVVWLR